MKSYIGARFHYRMPPAGFAAAATLCVCSIATAHAQGIWHHDIAGKAGTISQPFASIVDKSGDIITTGLLYEDNRFSTDPQTVATIAYDRNGHMLWEHTQPLTFNPHSSLSPQGFSALDSAGDSVFLLLTDYFNSTPPLLFKFSPTGKVLIDEPLIFSQYTDEIRFAGFSVDAAHDDSIVMTGYGYFDTPHHTESNSSFAAKYDSPGKQVWLRTQGYASDGSGLDTSYYGSTLDSAGNLVITGYKQPADGTFNGFEVTKYDPAGNLLYNHVGLIGTFFQSHGQAVAVDKDDDIYVGGEEAPMENDLKLVTAKFTPGGTQLWATTYNVVPGTSNGGSVSNIATDTNGDVVVGGVTTSSPDETPMLTLLKYDGITGTQDWAYRHSEGFTTFYEQLLGLYTDSDNNVYAVDSDPESRPNVNHNISIEISRKFAPDGALIYQHNYDGSPNHLYSAHGLTSAFDPAIDGLYAIGDADFTPGGVFDAEDDWYIVAYQP